MTGVIVTADGLVLCGATGQADWFEVLTSDGRRSKGQLAGWSGEWGIALLRIDGTGPWPFTPLGEATGVKPGQLVMAYDNRSRVRLETVDRVAPARWFGTTWANTSFPWGGEVLFDLDGKLVGLGETRNADARLYADIKVVKSMWEDLVAGKDVDRERLWTKAQRSEDIKFFEPGTPVTEVVRARASAATVRMRDAAKTSKRELKWSGVIVDQNGLIMTCAHHEKMPGTRLSISLMDGRTVPGIILGVNPITDVGIVRITEPGTWTHVELGDSRRLRPGAHCVSVGYPMNFEAGRPPQVGAGVVIPPSNRMFVAGSYALHAKMDPPTEGGMSGGGVFDPDGRLVAINGSNNPLDGEMFHRIEVARTNWDELAHQEYLVLKGPHETEEAYGELHRAADPMRRSVVTILDGKKPVALGMIVGSDGRILTRASALPNAPSCRLADGRVMPAAIERTSGAGGLALLKIPADGLEKVGRWSSRDIPAVGQLIAVPNPDEPTMVGSVTCGAHQSGPVIVGDDGRSPQDRFPRVYEIGVASYPELTGGPVVDAEGQLSGFVVAASESSLIVVPPSVGRKLLDD